MRSKSLALSTTLIFLIRSFACSHSPPKPPSPDPHEEISSQKEIARSLSTPKGDDPWWKKDENRYLLAVLIILGVGIAASASIWILYNANGLTINVHKENVKGDLSHLSFPACASKGREFTPRRSLLPF